MVFMTDAADHVTGKTGLTLTITASKAGAGFASISPSVVDRGSGWYDLALTAAHTDTLGDLALHVTGTGADPSDLINVIVAGSLDADISGVAASVWATVLDAGLTATEITRLMIAVLAGKSSGGGTTTITFRNLADSKDRIVATVDANGNRTAVTRDPS